MRTERFKTLVEQHPDNELYRFSLAQALIRDGLLEDAEPHLRLCIKKKPDWMMAHILLGKTMIERGRPDAARPILGTAHRLAVEQAHEEPESELRVLLERIG